MLCQIEAPDVFVVKLLGVAKGSDLHLASNFVADWVKILGEHCDGNVGCNIEGRVQSHKLADCWHVKPMECGREQT